MAKRKAPKKAPRRKPTRRGAPAEKGIELTDDQLEMVIGGLNLDAWQAFYGGYMHGPQGYGKQ